MIWLWYRKYDEIKWLDTMPTTVQQPFLKVLSLDLPGIIGIFHGLGLDVKLQLAIVSIVWQCVFHTFSSCHICFYNKHVKSCSASFPKRRWIYRSRMEPWQVQLGAKLKPERRQRKHATKHTTDITYMPNIHNHTFGVVSWSLLLGKLFSFSCLAYHDDSWCI